MKKILIVTPYFYPKIGGLENYAFNLSKMLKKKYKLEVIVITANHINKTNKIEWIEGIKIYRIAYLFKISNTPVNPFWVFTIKKIIKKENPDIINAHTPVPFIADITALVVGKIPFLVTYHANSLYKYNVTLFNLFIKLYKQFEYLLFNKATNIIVVSKVIKDAIPAKFGHKVVIINNSLPKEEIAKLKKQTNLPRNILFIGSLDKTHNWKGLNEILEAIRIIKEYSHVNFYIIGDGNNKQNYQQIVKTHGIEKNVHFLGRKEKVEKQKIFKQSTLGIIYPISSNDAFPTVILEYWANSIAIVASNINPINKIIKNNKNGYLVKAKDPKALAKAILELMKNKQLINNLSLAGYNELKTNYTLEREFEKFYSLSKSLI